jgi:glutamate 5-kinase
VAAARRVVLKLGTRVVTHPDGHVALPRIFAVVETASRLRREGRQVLIVSSGAVGLGVEALGFSGMPADLMERQACAAVGQTRLMGLYEAGFQRLGQVCGQVLLTRGDFEDRLRYLNLRSTLQTLLRHGVVPIINENDAVATDELAFFDEGRRHAFGDNDGLSALVAAKLDADLLVLLTDVAGVFDRDPRAHPDARLLERIDLAEPSVTTSDRPGSKAGRGGMRRKIEAARLVARAGCQAVVASGVEPGALDAVLAGDEVGTWLPAEKGLDGRRRWIAFAAATRGRLDIDRGAVEALRERKASLLAAGVRRVEGDFRTGDVVELRGPGGESVGRGIAFWDAEVTRAWCAGDPPAGIRNHDALIDRDNMILEAGARGDETGDAR